jgi:hypothetical protein
MAGTTSSGRMKQSDRYHAQAAECLRLADGTEDQQRRVILINMRECWHALAARAATAEDGTKLDVAG